MKALILLLLVVGCARPGAHSVDVMQQRQVALDRIADNCGAPRTHWKLLDEDHLTLEAAAYSSERSTNCLITELGKSGIPVKLGFIAEPPPEKQR